MRGHNFTFSDGQESVPFIKLEISELQLLWAHKETYLNRVEEFCLEQVSYQSQSAQTPKSYYVLAKKIEYRIEENSDLAVVLETPGQSQTVSRKSPPIRKKVRHLPHLTLVN